MLEFILLLVATFVAPILLDQSNRRKHFEWVGPWLREAWALLFAFLVFYVFWSPAGKEIAMTLHPYWRTYQFLGYVSFGILGAIIFCGYWRFIGSITQAESNETYACIAIFSNYLGSGKNGVQTVAQAFGSKPMTDVRFEITGGLIHHKNKVSKPPQEMFEGSVFIGPLIPGEASSLPYKLHPSDDGISTYLIDITSTTEVLHEELSVRFAGVDKGWDIKYTVQKDNKVLRSQDWSEPLTP